MPVDAVPARFFDELGRIKPFQRYGSFDPAIQYAPLPPKKGLFPNLFLFNHATAGLLWRTSGWHEDSMAHAFPYSAARSGTLPQFRLVLISSQAGSGRGLLLERELHTT
jgi:hypothetical protein